jgi:hypothetical protein
MINSKKIYDEIANIETLFVNYETNAPETKYYVRISTNYA